MSVSKLERKIKEYKANVEYYKATRHSLNTLVDAYTSMREALVSEAVRKAHEEYEKRIGAQVTMNQINEIRKELEDIRNKHIELKRELKQMFARELEIPLEIK